MLVAKEKQQGPSEKSATDEEAKMESYGIIWNHMESYGIIWNHKHDSIYIAAENYKYTASSV